MAAKAIGEWNGVYGHGKEDLYHAVKAAAETQKLGLGMENEWLDMTLSFLSSPRELILKDFSANLRLLKKRF